MLNGKEDEDRILDLEFQHFFEGSEAEDPIYKVQILNNIRVEQGLLFSSRRECEFCRREHKDNCDFAFNDPKLTLKDLVRQMDASRNLVLVVNWRVSNPKANISLIEKPLQVKLDLSSSDPSF